MALFTQAVRSRVASRGEVVKKILTIRGPIDPNEVGPTLMHEHLMVDLSCNFVHAADASARSLLHAPVTIEMLALLRRRPFSVTLDNMVLGDEALALRRGGTLSRRGWPRRGGRDLHRNRSRPAGTPSHLARVRPSRGHGRGLLHGELTP